MAGGQRRLGDLARALLGHPAAALALRRLRRGDGCRRLRRTPRARGGPARRGLRSAPSLRRRHPPPLRVRRRGRARARGHRRLVRQRCDALRAAPLPVRRRGRAGRAVPGGLHLRGAGPDPRLVLLAARRGDDALRQRRLPQRGLPRAHPRRRGPQDEQEPRERHRAVDGPRPFRSRPVPLVPAHRAAGRRVVSLQPRGDRRGHAPLPAHVLEHLRVPRHLRGAAGRLVAG